MEYLISMYIDNELDLDEKIHFIEEIDTDKGFKDNALSLLEQEKNLHVAIRQKAPEVSLPVARKVRFFHGLLGPTRIAIAVSLLAVFSFFLKDYVQNKPTYEIQPVTSIHRFVIYQEGIQKVEIAGSFTNWQPLPLQPAGTSGYWETTLQLPVGEHRFVYILDGDKLFADPTVSAQESDDYGTTNSILSIGV